ncbi:hypothetical protein GDO81_004298 [Engystomops pustulosus]|uniref:Uncharacterized protein n=1 Tax=Engystomops pustulosus TaxID=76066 RepID=A0AAV6ZX40_ENGPU|nr:hypothetical protein GDO81_004298 [Engystomops pustulosus]
MSGIKGGPCGQKIQCQDPCKNPRRDPCQKVPICVDPCQKVPICVDPCQKVPICVDPCQDPCKPGRGSYNVYKQDPCNPCCPDPCQGQGGYYSNK